MGGRVRLSSDVSEIKLVSRSRRIDRPKFPTELESRADRPVRVVRCDAKAGERSIHASARAVA
jgi:hypothetical protein